MDLEGFNGANVAIIDGASGEVVNGNNGLSDSGVFSINAGSSLGVINASISGLAPSTQNIAGSNEIVAVSGQGTGAVTCTLGVNALPTDIKFKLIGAEQGPSGAWHLDSDTRSPYAAMELITKGRNPKTKDTDFVHIGLPKGQFFLQSQNIRTNSGTGSINRATDSLQFKAVNRSNDHQVYQVGVESDSSFRLDSFRSELFNGATLSNPGDSIDPTTAKATDNGQPVQQ